jgi:hypothetical protein
MVDGAWVQTIIGNKFHSTTYSFKGEARGILDPHRRFSLV